jgi:hypothetical protein
MGWHEMGEDGSVPGLLTSSAVAAETERMTLENAIDVGSEFHMTSNKMKRTEKSV